MTPSASCVVALAFAAALCAAGCTRAPDAASSPAATSLPAATRMSNGPRAATSRTPAARAVVARPSSHAGSARPVAARPAASVTVSAPASNDPRPYILDATISPTTVGSGAHVSAFVQTTAGVVGVAAYAGGSSIALTRVAPGRFAVATTLPVFPPYVHGVFPVTFVARDGRGRTTQSARDVTVP